MDQHEKTTQPALVVDVLDKSAYYIRAAYYIITHTYIHGGSERTWAATHGSITYDGFPSSSSFVSRLE
jgi:hypothetical protein